MSDPPKKPEQSPAAQRAQVQGSVQQLAAQSPPQSVSPRAAAQASLQPAPVQQAVPASPQSAGAAKPAHFRSDYDLAYEHDRKARKKFRLRVVYNRNGCIGSSHCILSDIYDFELDEEIKAVLKGGGGAPECQGGVCQGDRDRGAAPGDQCGKDLHPQGHLHH